MSITSTLIIQMIVFLILIWFTMKFVWPPITAALDERAKKIADGLSAADKAKSELAAANKRVEAQLSAARDDAAKRLAKQTDPAVAGRLAGALGLAYMNLGRHNDADPLMARSINDLAAAFGESDKRTARARGDYARLLTVQGRFKEAEDQYGRALASLRAAPTPDQDMIARLLCNLGFARMVQMDVRQQHGLEVVERQAARGQIRLERRQIARRPRVDQRKSRRPLQDGRGNHPGSAAEMPVGITKLVRKDVHWRTS